MFFLPSSPPCFAKLLYKQITNSEFVLVPKKTFFTSHLVQCRAWETSQAFTASRARGGFGAQGVLVGFWCSLSHVTDRAVRPGAMTDSDFESDKLRLRMDSGH